MPDPKAIAGVLEDALKAMLLDDEDITARAAGRRTNGVLKHATDITRQPLRSELILDPAVG